MQYFDKVVYTFSADNEPTGTIDSGEIVIFRTQDCFSNQMHSESQLVTSCDYSKMNPATGPLFVRDAQPGDVIKVELLDVQCDTIGTTTTLPKIGPLWDKCETRTKRIPIENGKAVFNDVTFPINPMIGVIGVAPEKGKSVPCGYPGSHGGNLDCKLMVKGNTAYFPVRVEGGLVQMGDMHAVMGDSELCGTGLEINGTVIARVSVIKNCPLEWPVLETADTWYTMAKDIIHALLTLSKVIAADPEVRADAGPGGCRYRLGCHRRLPVHVPARRPGNLPGLQALRSGPHRAPGRAQGRHEASPGWLAADRPTRRY